MKLSFHGGHLDGKELDLPNAPLEYRAYRPKTAAEIRDDCSYLNWSIRNNEPMTAHSACDRIERYIRTRADLDFASYEFYQ